MAEKNEKKDKRNATQRIGDLEQALMGLFQTADNMARDLTTVRDAIKLLGNKLDSVAKAANLSDDVIAKLMIQNNVAELKEKVTNLVTQGILVPAEEMNDTSFVVGQEIDAEGNVVNPRIQFTLTSIQPELRDKIKAAKVGEAVVLEEGKLKFMPVEIYTIVPPQAPAIEAAAAKQNAEVQSSDNVDTGAKAVSGN